MDDPYIFKQDHITSPGRGRACTVTPGTLPCQARRRGLDAWMTLVYLNRTVLQVPDVGGPVQRPLEPSRVWQRRGENQQSSQTQAGGLGFASGFTSLFSCILICYAMRQIIITKTSIVEPEPRAEELKLNRLLEPDPEPKL